MSDPVNATVASSIRSALAGLGVPIVQINYAGDEQTYLTFNMISTPDDFGDDEPGADVWSVQLHLFAPFTSDTTTLRRQIKRALVTAGFTAPTMTDASENTRASDGTEQHIVFEFETATDWGAA